MPLQGWAHSLYWAGAGAPPDPAVDLPYARWQSTVIVPPISGGSGEPHLRTRWQRIVKLLRRWWRELGRRMPERLWLWWVISCLVWGRDLRLARQVVREIAVSPNIPRGADAVSAILENRSMYWREAENIYRNTMAARMSKAIHLTHRRQALLELAYLSLKERGR